MVDGLGRSMSISLVSDDRSSVGDSTMGCPRTSWTSWNSSSEVNLSDSSSLSSSSSLSEDSGCELLVLRE